MINNEKYSSDPKVTKKALLGVLVLFLGFCACYTIKQLIRKHSARYSIGVIKDVVGVAEGGPMAEVKYLVGNQWLESSVDIPSDFDYSIQKNLNDTFVVEYQKTAPGNFDFIFSKRIHININKIPADGWKIDPNAQ